MFDPNALLLLAALAAPLDSVAHVPSANDRVLASVISPLLKPGDRVRVHTVSGVTVAATEMVSPLGIRLRIDAQDIWSQPRTEALAWSQVERIDAHTKHAGNAARIGATVGCLLCLTMSAAAMSLASEEGRVGGGTVLLAYVGGGITGACIGGLAGGILGSLMPAWKTVYERR